MVTLESWLLSLNIWSVNPYRKLTINELKNTDELNIRSIIPNVISELQFLRKLDLSFSFNIISDAILDLVNLTVLHMEHCGIMEIPNNINQLKNLQYLNLSCNNITDIPNTICELKDLMVLDLSANNITQIPNKINKLTKLDALFLSRNNITNIPTSFYKLKIFCLTLDTITPNIVKLKNLDPDTLGILSDIPMLLGRTSKYLTTRRYKSIYYSGCTCKRSYLSTMYLQPINELL